MIDQYMTPLWLAEQLVGRYFVPLSTGDSVLEPTCGTGAFLRAIPATVRAWGVEQDPALADRARRESGRDVVVGDFLTVEIAERPTAVIGNPPFRAAFIDAMLERCHRLLPVDGPAGFLLPAYFFQNDRRIVGYAQCWGIETRIVPRTLFPRLSKPLVWAIFRKGRGAMVGLALFAECGDWRSMPAAYRALLRECAGDSWREVVTRALLALGGEAGLDAIYDRVAPRRPSGNPWWREKVRQQCQRNFERTARGRYRVPIGDFQLEAA